MFNLISKDFIISKGIFIDSLVKCLAINLIFGNTPSFIYIVCPPLIVYEFFKSSASYNYKYNSDIMFNSLPVSRKDMVFSKYIEFVIFFIFSLIITLVFTFIFRHMGVLGFNNINKFMHLDIINNLMNFQSIGILSFGSTILLISIYFPIYFKFEYLRIKNIFAFISIVICLIPILIMKIIGYENDFKLINYFSTGSGLIVSIVVIGILLLISYLSINISLEFYNNRDL